MPTRSARDVRRQSGHSGKHVARALISESFAWSAVQERRHSCRIVLRHVSERHSLREELADQTVEVLVGAALLGAVHVGEIYLALEQLLDRLVMAELETVVERDRVDGETTERNLDDVSNKMGIQTVNFPNDAEARGAVDQRQKRMA